MEFVKKHWAYLIIAIVYTVGFVGFLIPNIRQDWANLTAFSLIVSIVVLVFHHQPKSKSFYFSLILVGILGYIIEVIGVKTGILFGVYTYGNKLGPKLLEVPLILGINWALLLYLTHYFAKQLVSKTFQIAILGAFLMVGIDFLIEPFAIYFGLWTWEKVHVPIQNYFMWWIASFLLHLLFGIYNIQLKNKISNFILGSLVLFFFAVNLFVIWF
jgi:putative membrane protein